MQKRFIPLLSILLLGYLSVCAEASAIKIAPNAKQASLDSKASGAQKWDTILDEAKKEGTVSIYNTGWSSQLRVVLTRAFKEKYGINLEFTPFSRGSELAVKAETEQRTGLNLVDVFGCGAPSMVGVLKPRSLLGHTDQFLLLPEVTDPKGWSGGRFPFLDKDRLTVGMIANINRYMLYNTDLIKEGEITTYKDLLKPQYKGKITLNDPTVTGAGQGLMTHLAFRIWNMEEALEFLKQLIKQQQAVLQRDNRMQVESIAKGKFAVALAPQPETVADFIKLGAPLKVIINKDGTSADVGAGGLAISAKPPHPNAATVFVNWLLSKEGQTVFSGTFGLPSMRIDTPKDKFLPVFLPQPGEKIYWMNEEIIAEMGKAMTESKKLVDAIQ